ncbi:MAG: UDP-N-acetylmuramoyl-L-alanine--D-glutamate ligase [Puniceicoccales bacterium]|jgi:UDP-N-acetylmuramoylalanine--D-glutamate ligase|nr:UDP-N-acetylmuramoyl-L-alanine--D-glutamate ligase [Puniceicoccales bacterium]
MNILNLASTVSAIGILGGGVTGKAVERFCKKMAIPCKIFNEFGPEEEQFSEWEAKKYPLIVRSPSFMTSHKWVQLAAKAGCRCIAELDLAACLWHGKIVAVTGTNGKTTTVEFLAHALKLCGKRAVPCGNIGYPFIDLAMSDCNSEETWAVVEVSSFQMNGATIFSPDFVLWTNFANDHLDAHESLAEYFDCKSGLIRNAKQSDDGGIHCFVGQSVHDFRKQLRVDDIAGKYLLCTSCDMLPKNSTLNAETQRRNFALVQKFWQCAGLPADRLVEAALTFQLPPHRLQMTKKVYQLNARGKQSKAVEFWDDSKATNFHALDAALASFSRPVILIAGGKSKNEPIGEFWKVIDGRVKGLLLIGETGEILNAARELDEGSNSLVFCKFFPRTESVKDAMANAVQYAFSMASDGDIVLLSPGFSSLDWFENYVERGKFFLESVLCLNLPNK